MLTRELGTKVTGSVEPPASCSRVERCSIAFPSLAGPLPLDPSCVFSGSLAASGEAHSFAPPPHDGFAFIYRPAKKSPGRKRAALLPLLVITSESL
jgi:hypothetical protein